MNSNSSGQCFDRPMTIISETADCARATCSSRCPADATKRGSPKRVKSGSGQTIGSPRGSSSDSVQASCSQSPNPMGSQALASSSSRSNASSRSCNISSEVRTWSSSSPSIQRHTEESSGWSKLEVIKRSSAQRRISSKREQEACCSNVGYSDRVGGYNCSSFTASAVVSRPFVAIMRKAMATRPLKSADLVLCCNASPPSGVWFPTRIEHSGMRLFQPILVFGLKASKFCLRLRGRITWVRLGVQRFDRFKPTSQLLPHA